MNLSSVGGQVGFFLFFSLSLSPVFVCCLITDKGTCAVEKVHAACGDSVLVLVFFPPQLRDGEIKVKGREGWGGVDPAKSSLHLSSRDRVACHACGERCT